MLEIANYNIITGNRFKKNNNSIKSTRTSNEFKRNALLSQNITPSYNLTFTGKHVPIYILKETPEGESYTLYKSPNEAAKALNVPTSKIYSSLNNATNINDECIAVRQEQVETELNNGKKEFSKVQANKLLQRLHKNEVYMLSKADYKLEKFKNRKEAAIAYGIPMNIMNYALCAAAPTSLEAVPFKAFELESENEEGKMELDREKLRKAKEEISKLTDSNLKKKAIYMVSNRGYLRFNSQKEASEVLNIPLGDIYNAIYREGKVLAGKYIAIKASGIEDKKGNITDKSQIQAAVIYLRNFALKNNDKNIQADIDITPLDEITEKEILPQNYIYLLESDGSYKSYSSLEDASEDLGVLSVTLKKALIDDKIHIIKGKIPVKAEKVQNDEGETDTVKLNRILQNFNKNAFYAVRRKENKIRIRKYNKTQKEVSEMLAVPAEYISFCLNGKMQKTPQGYYFIKAQLVETEQQDGTMKLDNEKIKSHIIYLEKLYRQKVSNGK